MKRKTILMTLVIAAALFAGSFPTIVGHLAVPPEPQLDCWVVTDEIENIDKAIHNYYTERTGEELESDHEQVWFTDGNEPHSISQDGTWIDTTVSAYAESSGNNTILYVTTSGQDREPPYYRSEEIRWTVINGYVETAGYYKVKVTWVSWASSGPPQQDSEEVQVDIDYYIPDVIHLGHCQELDLELTYVDCKCPGQREYWVVTENEESPEIQEYTIPTRNAQNGYSEGELNLVWWTDKLGDPQPISENGWHINTKCKVWAESINTDDALIHVKIYGESNYYPEWINWTVTDGAGWIDPYFTLNVSADSPASDFDTIVYIDDLEEEFQTIGELDHLDVTITYYGENPDP